MNWKSQDKPADSVDMSEIQGRAYGTYYTLIQGVLSMSVMSFIILDKYCAKLVIHFWTTCHLYTYIQYMESHTGLHNNEINITLSESQNRRDVWWIPKDQDKTGILSETVPAQIMKRN